MIGHLSTYVKVIIAADANEESKVIEEVIREEKKKEGEGRNGEEKEGEGEGEGKGEEKEGMKISSKSSLETKKKQKKSEGGIVGETEAELADEGGGGLERGSEDIWEGLAKAGIVGGWMDVDIVGASRFFVIGIRSKKE